MFVILLRSSNNRGLAGQFMADHNEWIAQGIRDAACFWSSELNLGGAIVAHGTGLEDLRVRVKDDPFVAHDVVASEIFEIAPSRVDQRLSFLLALVR